MNNLCGEYANRGEQQISDNIKSPLNCEDHIISGFQLSPILHEKCILIFVSHALKNLSDWRNTKITFYCLSACSTLYFVSLQFLEISLLYALY